MPTIKIAITEKRATVEGAPIIICGNSDYTVAFTFDSEWASHSTKTARFAYKQGGEFRYEDKIFSGTTCAVPALIDTDLVAIGVYAGNLRTSTPAAIKCAPSVLCLGKLPADPLPSVYNQLITLINTRTPADTAWHNVTANALKGYVSGEVVTLFDVSPIEHELGVRVHGKNLIPSYKSETKGGLTVKLGADGSLTFNGTATSTYSFVLPFDAPPGPYVFTANNSQAIGTGGTNSPYYALRAEDNTWLKDAALTVTNRQSTFTATRAITSFLFVVPAGVTLADFTVKLQLERGTTATEYEAWADPTPVEVGGVGYTPDEYGKITGIGSVSPSMTLTASTGMQVDVTYNRDITKVINALEQALLANN